MEEKPSVLICQPPASPDRPTSRLCRLFGCYFVKRLGLALESRVGKSRSMWVGLSPLSALPGWDCELLPLLPTIWG